MKLRNNFSEKTRNLFLYEYACLDCGRSDQGLEIHHREGRCSDSPLNACIICCRCHTKGKRDENFRQRMAKKILDFLEKQEYIMTKEDDDFYNKYMA